MTNHLIFLLIPLSITFIDKNLFQRFALITALTISKLLTKIIVTLSLFNSL
jgi:hypothetical protein